MSDRILVMSERPGRIIEEIPVDLPDRDNPFGRRQNDGVTSYLRRLTELLDLAHAEV